MSYSSNTIPDWVIPGIIHMIPFSFYFDEIPGMVHGRAADHLTGNSKFIFHDITVSVSISVTHCHLVHERPICRMRNLRQAAIIQPVIVILAILYQIIMHCQSFLQITHRSFCLCHRPACRRFKLQLLLFHFILGAKIFHIIRKDQIRRRTIGIADIALHIKQTGMAV